MSTELQAFNGKNKLEEWAVRISECRNSGQSVKNWCRENGIREQTYYRWQKRLFEMTKAEQEVQFAEVTQPESIQPGNVAVTIRLAELEADIHNGADTATIEAVLRILRSC